MLGNILNFNFSDIPKISDLNPNRSTRVHNQHSASLHTEIQRVLQADFVQNFYQIMLGVHEHKRSKSISEDFFDLFKKSDLSKQYPFLNHHILELMAIQDLFDRLLELVRSLENISIPITELYTKSLLFKKVLADDVNFNLKLLEYDGECLRKTIIYALVFLFSSIINKQIESLHRMMFDNNTYRSSRDDLVLRLRFDLGKIGKLASVHLKDKGINSQDLVDMSLFLSTSLLDGPVRKLEFFAGREYNSEKLKPIFYSFYMACHRYFLSPPRPFTTEDLNTEPGYIGKHEYQKKSDYGVMALYSEPSNYMMLYREGFELDLSRVLYWGSSLETLQDTSFSLDSHGFELGKLNEIVEVFTSVLHSSRYSMKSKTRA